MQVRTYKRLSPLVVQGEELGGLGGAAAGDCLVGFSRRSLHGLRREVVRRTGREACLVSSGSSVGAAWEQCGSSGSSRRRSRSRGL